MNLLTDSLFRVVAPDGQKTTMNLPALLAALGRDMVESLPGLKRHQEDAFLVFLSQLGAGVLARTGESKPAQNEEFWRDSIREVTGRKDDLAWTLVVGDVTKPAFMQAPLLKEVQFDEKKNIDSFDELDVLVTSKNHDVKRSRGMIAELDDWIYALMSLQTMTGVLGSGKHGIARMNGGYGNRPFVEIRQSERYGQLWSRHVQILLKKRQDLLEGPWKYKNDGLLFIWTKLWDLATPLSLSALDPFFIEIARAVRLSVSAEGRIFAKITGSSPKKEQGLRINAVECYGILGDPWTPINKKKNTSLTVAGSGFTPKLICDLFFNPDFEQSEMMSQDGITGSLVWLYASVLVRGQGGTDGFHTTKIMIPKKARHILFQKKQDDGGLAALSKSGLDNAATMQNKVLKASLLSFLEGGPEKINFDRNEAVAWFGKMAERFRLEWESQFYDWLWDSAGEEKDAAIKRWAETLKEIAEGIFEDSIKRLPSRTGRQMRSVVRAESVFKGSLYNNFPMLRKETTNAENP